MVMTLCPLFSGSSGNAFYVATEKTRLLIDAGLSGKAILCALDSIGVDPSSLNGILITHEHSDHIKGAGILSRKFHLPLYASTGTWEAMGSLIGPVSPANVRQFHSTDDFYVKDIGVVPFSIPHDAADPVGFRLFYGGYSFSLATDLGYYSKQVHQHIQGSDVVLLESNHDEDMLLANPKYPLSLKRRILGRKGHLSNNTCADAALQLFESGVNHIILGHLSGENNMPELAFQATEQSLAALGVAVNKDVGLDVAPRKETGNLYTLCHQSPSLFAVGT
ncbi:MAG: MBL fold metallo-hydrolase [Clostridiales bacterium]|nr:MBL fold metallo-hydrolase [Clostridiales bacterium]